MKLKNKVALNLILSTLMLIIYQAQSVAADYYLRNNKAPISKIKVVNIYPHDPEAFTQGLFYRDGFLYESTGLVGKSSLRKVDLATGKIIKKIKLPDKYFGEGITYFNNKIYQLTWTNQKGFIYDFKTLKKTAEFNYEGEGWGIASDGKKLFMSDGSSKIQCREPASLKILKTLNVHDGKEPITGINELEFIKGEIWANIFMQSVIVRISPHTGKILGWIDLSLLYNKIPKYYSVDVLNGIAYDENNDRIFVTGKYWPYVFKIKINNGV